MKVTIITLLISSLLGLTSYSPDTQTVHETLPEVKQASIKEPLAKPELKEQKEAVPKAAPVPKVQETLPSAPTVQVSGNCAKYLPLVSQYDWHVPTMMRILKAESGCSPTNHNWTDNHGSCLGSYGLFQIGCVHGYSVAYLENPANNIAAAYKVWNGGNYAAWSTW